MVLGLLVGSAVQALLPRRWIASALGKSGLGTVVVGGMVSLPMMMCTCCAAPVVTGLRECRATAGAAIAFWLGNTVLNPATLVFTGFVLGWNWSIFRLVFGVLLVFGLGFLANHLAGSEESVAIPENSDADLVGEQTSVLQTLAGRACPNGDPLDSRIPGAGPGVGRSPRLALPAHGP